MYYSINNFIFCMKKFQFIHITHLKLEFFLIILTTWLTRFKTLIWQLDFSSIHIQHYVHLHSCYIHIQHLLDLISRNKKKYLHCCKTSKTTFKLLKLNKYCKSLSIEKKVTVINVLNFNMLSFQIKMLVWNAK